MWTLKGDRKSTPCLWLLFYKKKAQNTKHRTTVSIECLVDE